MSYFIIQFLLKTEKYQEDILDKRFKIGRQIYNSLLNITQKRYREMIKTKKYRNLISQLSGNKTKDKDIWKQINDIRKQFSMSEYSFFNDIKRSYNNTFLRILTLVLHEVLHRIFGEHTKNYFIEQAKMFTIRNMVL